MSRKPSPHRRLSSEERRQAILEAAVPLFAREGFRGVTTKQMAKEAGVSEALLYQHFPSKEALYAEVQAHCCRIPDGLRDMLMSLPPSTETLVRLLHFFVSVILEEPAWSVTPGDLFTRLILNSCLDDGHFARLHFDVTARPMSEKMVKSFEAARAAGDLVADGIPDDLRWWLCHHVVVTMQLYQLPTPPVIAYSEKRPEQLKRHALLYMLRGLGLTPEAIARHLDVERLEAAVRPWLTCEVERSSDAPAP